MTVAAGLRSPSCPSSATAVGLAGPCTLDPSSAIGQPVSVLREQTDSDRGRTLNRHAGRLMQRRMLGLMSGGWRTHRLATCGFSMEPGRTFRVRDGKARSVGVELCGNSRCCQVCGPAESAKRAAEIAAGVWRWLETAGHSAWFVSFAPSHARGDDLATLALRLLDARGRAMRSDRAEWRKVRAQLGIADVAWVVEMNHGANGPHPGLHMILLTTREWEPVDVDRAEAWLWLELRRELQALGDTRRMSVSAGIDVRPVDDPAGLGRYLTKWGIGHELAAQTEKLGRNGENVPYSAIPAILAAELGRRDLAAAMRRDRRVCQLVEAWQSYVAFAVGDKRHRWYSGFRTLNKLVPELREAHTRNERIAVCTELLPAELRPARHDDAEESTEDGEEQPEGEMLTVEAEPWAAAQRAWWGDRARLPLAFHRWRCSHAPLELVVCWIAEDCGVSVAATAAAELVGATVRRDGRYVVDWQ